VDKKINITCVLQITYIPHFVFPQRSCIIDTVCSSSSYFRKGPAVCGGSVLHVVINMSARGE